MKEGEGLEKGRMFSSIDGTYVGEKMMDKKLLEYFKEKEIEPEGVEPGAKIATIGFSKKDNEWYGWSHRAIYSFGLGHVTKEGDSGVPQYIPAGFVCKTLEDCKRVASAFARDVS